MVIFLKNQIEVAVFMTIRGRKHTSREVKEKPPKGAETWLEDLRLGTSENIRRTVALGRSAINTLCRSIESAAFIIFRGCGKQNYSQTV